MANERQWPAATVGPARQWPAAAAAAADSGPQASAPCALPEPVLPLRPGAETPRRRRVGARVRSVAASRRSAFEGRCVRTPRRCARREGACACHGDIPSACARASADGRTALGINSVPHDMALLSMIIRYPFPGSVVLLAYDLLSCSCFDLLVSSCPVIAGALFWDCELVAQLVYVKFIVRIGTLIRQSGVQV